MSNQITRERLASRADTRSVRRNGTLPQVKSPQVNGQHGNGTRRRKSSKPAGGVKFALLPSFHAEPTREALLQSGPGRRADRMTIAYHEPSVAFDLVASGRTLLAGDFETELVVDGVPVVPRGDWKSVCWYGDDDCDFLELQLQCTDSVHIERQFLLSRRQHFALLAEAVISASAARIEARLKLPLFADVPVIPDRTTRELQVGAARVFPLALSQERVVSSPGEFRERDGQLELAQVSRGAALYLPLLFDWHPRRRRAPADWRSLTVTEPRTIVSPDRAAGHRLRLGKEQWLFYRSLLPTIEPRAVLGHHTRYETLVGTFDSDGDVEPIVMVEVD